MDEKGGQDDTAELASFVTARMSQKGHEPCGLRFMGVFDREGGEIEVSRRRDLNPAVEVPEVWPTGAGWGLLLSLLVPLLRMASAMVGLVVVLVIDMGVVGAAVQLIAIQPSSDGVCLDGVEVVVMLVCLGR